MQNKFVRYSDTRKKRFTIRITNTHALPSTRVIPAKAGGNPEER